MGQDRTGEASMTTMRHAVSGAIAIAAVFSLFASTMALAQGQGGGGRPATEDTSAATECTGDQVLDGDGDCVDILQLPIGGLTCTDGQIPKFNGATWACADDDDTDTDTSAATEWGLGEVLVADGTGGGVCFPASFTWDNRFAEDSACPCGSAIELLHVLPWVDLQPVSCLAFQSDNGDGVCDGVGVDSCSFEVRNTEGREPGLRLFDIGEYLGPERSTTCAVRDKAGHSDFEWILYQVEWDDCLSDALALAVALGATCPSPPVVEGLP
jgi:hypothetical protein